MNFLKQHKWELAAGAALLVAVAIGGALWFTEPVDPHLARAQELWRKVSSGGQYPPEELRQYQDEFRQELKLLSPQDRQKLIEERQRMRAEHEELKEEHERFVTQRQAMIRDKIKMFFSWPEDRRVAFLDTEIDKLEEAREKGDLDQEEAVVGRLKKMVEWSAAEDRELVEKFARAVDERLKQRGLPPIE
jgi:hypothetical protein